MTDFRYQGGHRLAFSVVQLEAMMLERDAEIDRLRAELAEEQYESARRWDRFVEAEAAIARVRELCDSAIHPRGGYIYQPTYTEILRAVDGGTE